MRTFISFYILAIIVGCGGGSSQLENEPPFVSAGDSKTVKEQALVELQGQASDSDGSIQSILWTQVSGPTVALENANSLNPQFIAPVVYEYEGTQNIELQLTVVDDKGAKRSANNVVKVQPVNLPPVANAGEEQTFLVAEHVELSCHDSRDVDGEYISFKWLQTAGYGIEINNADSCNPSFRLPYSAGEVILELTVIDQDKAQAKDYVTINAIAYSGRQAQIALKEPLYELKSLNQGQGYYESRDGMLLNGNLLIVPNNSQIDIYQIDNEDPLLLSSIDLEGGGTIGNGSVDGSLFIQQVWFYNLDTRISTRQFWFIDISEPANPKKLKAIEFGEDFTADQYLVRDNYLYLIGETIRIFNLSDINNLQEVYTAPIQRLTDDSSYYHVYSATISKNSLFLSMPPYVYSVDITDKEEPQLSSIIEDIFAYSLKVTGDRLVVEQGKPDYTEVLIYQINEEGFPSLLGEIDTGSSYYSASVADDLMYVLSTESTGWPTLFDYPSHLQVYDISDLSNVRLVGRLESSGKAGEVLTDEKQVYLSDGTRYQHIVHASEKLSPLVGELALAGYTNDIVVGKNLAYISDWEYGISIVDIANSQDMQLIKTFEGGKKLGQLAIDGDNLFGLYTPPRYSGASIDNGLAIFDITNPQSVVHTALYSKDDRFYDISTRNDYVFLAGGNGVDIVNVKDKYQPELTSVASGDALSLALKGEDLFLGATWDVNLYDVSQVNEPELTNQIHYFTSDFIVSGIELSNFDETMFMMLDNYDLAPSDDCINRIAPRKGGTWRSVLTRSELREDISWLCVKGLNNKFVLNEQRLFTTSYKGLRIIDAFSDRLKATAYYKTERIVSGFAVDNEHIFLSADEMLYSFEKQNMIQVAEAYQQASTSESLIYSLSWQTNVPLEFKMCCKRWGM